MGSVVRWWEEPVSQSDQDERDQWGAWLPAHEMTLPWRTMQAPSWCWGWMLETPRAVGFQDLEHSACPQQTAYHRIRAGEHRPKQSSRPQPLTGPLSDDSSLLTNLWAFSFTSLHPRSKLQSWWSHSTLPSGKSPSPDLAPPLTPPTPLLSSDLTPSHCLLLSSLAESH